MSELLRAWSEGDQDAAARIIELAWPELHKIAQRCLANERLGHTLQATELVNEAYLKLVEIRRVEWQDREHFFAVGARLMRRILVDYARTRGFAKRGGSAKRVDFTESLKVDAESQIVEFSPAFPNQGASKRTSTARARTSSEPGQDGSALVPERPLELVAKDLTVSLRSILARLDGLKRTGSAADWQPTFDDIESRLIPQLVRGDFERGDNSFIPLLLSTAGGVASG